MAPHSGAMPPFMRRGEQPPVGPARGGGWPPAFPRCRRTEERQVEHVG